MLRGMMLALVLLLITLSAAHLGRDTELQEVLRLARTPKPVPSSSQSGEPVPSSAAPSPAPFASGTASSESRPPRFVLDAPFESLPPRSSEVSGEAPPESESTPSSQGASGTISALPASSHIDPSAENHGASNSSSSRDYTPRVPSEEEARAAADPYVKELFELTARSLEQAAELERQAMSDYLATPPELRATALPELAERYLPQVTALERRCDDEAERVLNRMTAALAAIGADDAIAAEARRAYQQEKSAQLARYAGLFTGGVGKQPATAEEEEE